MTERHGECSISIFVGISNFSVQPCVCVWGGGGGGSSRWWTSILTNQCPSLLANITTTTLLGLDEWSNLRGFVWNWFHKLVTVTGGEILILPLQDCCCWNVCYFLTKQPFYLSIQPNEILSNVTCPKIVWDGSCFVGYLCSTNPYTIEITSLALKRSKDTNVTSLALSSRYENTWCTYHSYD